jgi:hypothetical protein
MGLKDAALAPLSASATLTTDALNELILFSKSGKQRCRFSGCLSVTDAVAGAQAEASEYGEVVAQIDSSSDRLCSVLGNSMEMAQQTKMLAQAMAALVSSVKNEASTEQSREVQAPLCFEHGLCVAAWVTFFSLIIS